MIHLISTVVCDEYQELLNGDTNYISAFNEIVDLGICNFDLVNKWYGENEIALEKIIILSPKEEIICSTEQELKVEDIQVTLSELEIDFQEIGTYWILIYENDKLINKLPITVLNEV